MKYVKFNANPVNNKVADCVVRAIAHAINSSWEEVYDDLCFYGQQRYAMPNDKNTYAHYLMCLGYPMTSHVVKKGAKRPKVKDFVRGTHILSVASHLCCVIDGVLYDTFDCREKAVYKSWKVKE